MDKNLVWVLWVLVVFLLVSLFCVGALVNSNVHVRREFNQLQQECEDQSDKVKELESFVIKVEAKEEALDRVADKWLESVNVIRLPEGVSANTYMLPILREKGDSVVLDIEGGDMYLFQQKGGYDDIEVSRLPPESVR